MKKRKNTSFEYNVEDLKVYMAVSPREKLRFLEETRLFFLNATPRRSKKIWKKLRERGW